MSDVQAFVHSPLSIDISSSPHAVEKSAGRTSRSHLWWLLLLTVLGGVLRFAYIERPVLWGDEALTYSRVTGTYKELLFVLQNDGFGPLLYEMYWVMARKMTLSPLVMRFPPALAGTLMVPAMYLLARQFTHRQGALLAAAFTCCSAYLLAYSRDAKMYSELWLFATLHVASLLIWLRTRSRLAFWGWIACGLAMAGLQAISLILLPVTLLAVLTCRRWHWKMPIFFMIGWIIILAGPFGYYKYFNKWQQKSGGVAPGVIKIEAEKDPNWGEAGISWIDQINRGRSGMDYVLDCTTSYLFSYEWPHPHDFYGQHQLIPWVQPTVVAGLTLVLACLAIGALPWRAGKAGQADPIDSPPSARLNSHDDSPFIMPGDFAPASIDPNAYADLSDLKKFDSASIPSAEMQFATALVASKERISRQSHQVWWRTFLWLGAWLVLPTYGIFYCRSIADFVAPWHWFTYLENSIPLSTLLVVSMLTIWSLCAATLRERLARGMIFALVVAILFGACCAAYALWRQLYQSAGANQVHWKSVWHPRYLGVVWPAVALTVAILFMRIPSRMIRYGSFAILLALNLSNAAARVFVDNEPPMNRIARDVWDAQDESSTTRTFVNYLRDGPAPSQSGLLDPQGRYYLCQAAGLQPAPPIFRGDWRALNIKILPDIQPQSVAGAINKLSHVNRVVLWERFQSPRPASPSPDDPTAAALGDGWRLASHEDFAIRVFWNWREYGSCQRREYVRDPPR